jgi:hypothetical protein
MNSNTLTAQTPSGQHFGPGHTTATNGTGKLWVIANCPPDVEFSGDEIYDAWLEGALYFVESLAEDGCRTLQARSPDRRFLVVEVNACPSCLTHYSSGLIRVPHWDTGVLLAALAQLSETRAGSHLTVVKSPTNWSITLDAPNSNKQIRRWASGATLKETANNLVRNLTKLDH